MGKTHSVLEYMYRDASNYKAFGAILLAGRITDEDRARIEAKLSTDDLFIPEFVGVQPLQSQLDGFPSGDDHIWHEYLGLRAALPEEVGELVCWGTVAKFVEIFSALPDWNSKEMFSRVGLLLEEEPYSFMV